MKKLLLSFSVIFAFILYSLHQGQESSSVQVVAPNFQSPAPSPTSFPTPTPSPASASSNPPTNVNSSPTSTPTPIPVQTSSQYKNGEYTGDAADAFYGNIQVKAVISNGKITDVQFLQYPSDRRTSVMINSQAMPYLKQEAIQAQSSQVDIVSGATDSSMAFIQSLGSALAKAKN